MLLTAWIIKTNLVEPEKVYLTMSEYMKDYNIFDSKIEMLIDVAWSGKRFVREDGTTDTNKTKLRLVFNDVQQCDIKELYSWDFIMNCYLNYVTFEEDEYICFANDEKDPMIYIVCEDIDYEEIK